MERGSDEQPSGQVSIVFWMPLFLMRNFQSLELLVHIFNISSPSPIPILTAFKTFSLSMVFINFIMCLSWYFLSLSFLEFVEFLVSVYLSFIKFSKIFRNYFHEYSFCTNIFCLFFKDSHDRNMRSFDMVSQVSKTLCSQFCFQSLFFFFQIFIVIQLQLYTFSPHP